MTLELLADEVDGRLHAVIVRDGVVADLYADAAAPDVTWGSIYFGKVVKVDTKLDSALVDIGNGRQGFLPGKHVHYKGADESETRSGVSELLKAGDMVMVQVKSEGRDGTGGENLKLPRLTMRLYVPGLFLTYSPMSSQVTISRHIESESLIAATAKLKGKGGWIVRHHIDKAAEPDIEAEAKQLRDLWQKVLDAREALGGKPGLLQAGPNALVRALSDYGAVNFEHIYAGSKNILDQAIAWSRLHLPVLADSKRLRLFKPEKQGQRLFDIDDIYGVLESLREKTVHLEAGGTLVIEPTAAFTAVDVNQGSAPSIAAANLFAARELARQCRLRNLTGAILVDFINMDYKEERHRLLETLTEAFADDLGGAQVHGLTRLGILELTRKRRTASYAEKLSK